jgi:hypothetical protein
LSRASEWHIPGHFAGFVRAPLPAIAVVDAAPAAEFGLLLLNFAVAVCRCLPLLVEVGQLQFGAIDCSPEILTGCFWDLPLDLLHRKASFGANSRSGS